MSLQKYLAVGAGLALGMSAILYFNRKQKQNQFDSSVYTVDRLLEILEDIYFE
jgi:hypothetical protein